VDDVVQETLGAADESLTKPRSLDELRARVHVLFRRIDQEVVQYSGPEAVSQVGRDQVMHWPQGKALSSPI